MNDSKKNNLEKIVLGGGCFWCLDPVFQSLEGVSSVNLGYAGGEKNNPSYRDVCSGLSGHAQVLEITFDPSIVSLEKIFEIFFTLHDPTTLNRQGADEGTQYRSIILYDDVSQMILANKIVEKLENSAAWSNPIVTEIVPLEKFNLAEDYHQDYFNKNPEKSYCQIVIAPKLEKFNKVFKNTISF